jgi:hypothetical protein
MFALIVDRQATELDRPIGQALVSEIEPRSDKFSPRLARVDLSPATVHQ